MTRFVVVVGSVLWVVSACVVTRQPDPRLNAELEAMYETDQAKRREMAAVAAIFGDKSPQMLALRKKQRPVDDANIARLEFIIEEHGWPGRGLVGDKGAAAAFLVLQHADYDHQKRYLPLLPAMRALPTLRCSRTGC